jgi:hypothetical protein
MFHEGGFGMCEREIGRHGLGRVVVAPVPTLPPLRDDPMALAIAEHACVLSHASIALTGAAARLRAASSLPHESYLGPVDDTERTTA